jgi:uncharacterized protein with gpF-like domain
VEAARAVREAISEACRPAYGVARDAARQDREVESEAVLAAIPPDLALRIKAAIAPHLHESATRGARGEWEQLTARRSRAASGWRWKAAMPMPASVVLAVRRWLDGVLREPYWLDVEQSIRESVADAINAGTVAGESNPQIARRVQAVLGPTQSAHRAMNIAATEVAGSLNAGADASRGEVAKATGAVIYKRWMATLDGDVRPAHRAANGQRVKQDEDFVVGGERCSFPGDTRLSAGQRCRCRCAASSEVGEETWASPADLPAHHAPADHVYPARSRILRPWKGVGKELT